MYETFLEGMVEVNAEIKEEQRQKPKKPTEIKLPKLNKIK